MFPTESAPVGFLPSVGPLMCSKVRYITESPPTLSALVRPLACMGAVVHAKAGAVAEALPTLTADVGCWLQMGPVMYSQRGTLTKALATGVTVVWSLAQVILLVCGEIRAPPKTLLTLGTFVVLLFKVDPLMPDAVGAS